jgi:hypothetical protein
MSVHEHIARARKVRKLIALVPAPVTKSQAWRLAMTLSAFTPAQRERWARAAGVTTPSNLTWSLLCDAVRESATKLSSADRAAG